MTKNECDDKKCGIVYRILVNFVTGFALLCCLGFFSIFIETLHAFNITKCGQFYLDFFESARQILAYPLAVLFWIILGDNPDTLQNNYAFILLFGMFHLIIVSIIFGECVRLFVRTCSCFFFSVQQTPQTKDEDSNQQTNYGVPCAITKNQKT